MADIVNWPPTWSTLLLLPALFVGYTVHELAHAFVAFMLGDTSQVERKRLSFNPLRHVSWMGMIAFLLVGFGWTKPVFVDQTRLRFKNQAFGTFLVAISGSAANLLTALLVLFGTMVTVGVVLTSTAASPSDIMQFLIVEEPGLDAQGFVVAFTSYMIAVNLLLGLISLLPLPPLDGFLAVMSLVGMWHGVQGTRSALGSTTQPTPQTTGGDSPPQTPAQIHFEIGLEYHKAGQFEEAIARYRQALAHDEDFSLAYYNQGLAYWEKGRLPLATSAFRAVLESSRHADVRLPASLRLRELAKLEQEPGAELGSVPPPLDPGEPAQRTEDEVPALDPALARRVWLQMGFGTTAMLVGAFAIWLFITAVMLAGMT
jgi:Zn-dependent protease